MLPSTQITRIDVLRMAMINTKKLSVFVLLLTLALASCTRSASTLLVVEATEDSVESIFSTVATQTALAALGAQGGGEGDDVIFGGAGPETVEGGAGMDVIATYAGDDTIRGGDEPALIEEDGRIPDAGALALYWVGAPDDPSRRLEVSRALMSRHR